MRVCSLGAPYTPRLLAHGDAWASLLGGQMLASLQRLGQLPLWSWLTGQNHQVMHTRTQWAATETAEPEGQPSRATEPGAVEVESH